MSKAKINTKKFDLLLKLFLLFGLVLLVIFSIILLRKNPIISQINNKMFLATTYQPEAFTELYFEDHLTLPRVINPSQNYSFNFTIRNLENRDMTYTYEVYAENNESILYMEKNTVFIRKNESKTIRKDFVVITTFNKFKMVVNLVEKKQHIAFWIEGGNTQ